MNEVNSKSRMARLRTVSPDRVWVMETTRTNAGGPLFNLFRIVDNKAIELPIEPTHSRELAQQWADKRNNAGAKA